MRALIIFLVMFAGAAFIGGFAYLAGRRIRARWARIGVSITGALLALLGSTIFLAVQRKSTPASDSQIFNGHKTLRATLFDRALLGDPVPDDGDSRRERRDGSTYSDDQSQRASKLVGGIGFPPGAWNLAIELEVPDSVKVDEDVPVDVTLMGTQPLSSQPDQGLIVRTGKEVEVTPRPECENAPDARKSREATHTYCARIEWAVPTRLVIRAEKPGFSLITLELPKGFKDQLATHISWIALSSRNGTMETNFRPSPGLNGPGGPTSQFESSPRVYSAAKPVINDASLQLDFRRCDVTIPISWQTTLGVSAATFELLSRIGTIFSALLGTGWLLKILMARRALPPGASEETEG